MAERTRSMWVCVRKLREVVGLRWTLASEMLSTKGVGRFLNPTFEIGLKAAAVVDP
jgi:hypothetical protein